MLLLAGLAHAAIISTLNGDVRVRRGLEETWQPASRGMELDDMDTILTLEGSVELEFDHKTFFMGSHSILDIGDLRDISRREMFLFLMAQKVNNIPPRSSDSMRISNASTVHGSKKSADTGQADESDAKWRREYNAAMAMYDQEFYTNSVVKLHKIRTRYSQVPDCGKIDFLLGKSFEQLDEVGQAVDAYQRAIQNACDASTDMLNQAKQRVSRLSR